MIAIPILLGMVTGVLVNALADNLLREDPASSTSLLTPRCRYCDSPRKILDRSAILSSLFTSGGCHRCGAPRPFRDLLVEALLWIGWPALFLIGKTGVHELLIGGFILSAFLLFTVIDFEYRYVVVEAVVIVSCILLLDGWTLGTEGAIRVLAGGVTGFLIFLFLFFLGKALAAVFRFGQGVEPLGFGDVILAALVGFVVGWPAILLSVLVSIFLAGLAGIILLAVSSIHRKPVQNATMAYGPYLLISGLLIYLFGSQFLGGIFSVF